MRREEREEKGSTAREGEEVMVVEREEKGDLRWATILAVDASTADGSTLALV